jgi:hypothetical protein
MSFMYNIRKPEVLEQKLSLISTLLTTNPTEIEHGPDVKNSANNRPINV